MWTQQKCPKHSSVPCSHLFVFMDLQAEVCDYRARDSFPDVPPVLHVTLCKPVRVNKAVQLTCEPPSHVTTSFRTLGVAVHLK